METKPTIIIFSAFYEPFVSGAERFAVEAVARLGDRYRFVVLTSRLNRTLPRREEKNGALIVRLGLGANFDKYLFPILSPFAALWQRPALAHAVMESYAGIALWLFGLLRPRVPRVLTLQSGDLDSAEKQRRIPGWLWARIHRSPDYVTAISNFLADRAKRLRGAARELDVMVLPNGVDLQKIPSARERVPGRIVCVARMAWEKGLNNLIEAFAEIRKTNSEAHLVLVGDGPEREKLEKISHDLGLENFVAFRGQLSNTEALAEVSRASVFACPSLAEGLGIVFLEAQAVGVPSVGTRVGGIPDVIADGETGLLVPPNNPFALAAAIERMLTDRVFADACVARAKEKVPHFSWQRIMEELAAIYERLRRERRILLATGIYPPASGGPATYVKTIAPQLSKLGWRPHILTYGDHRTEAAPAGVKRTVVWKGLPPGVRHLVYAWQCFSLGRSVDVIYSQDSVSAGAPAVLANLFLRRRSLLKVVGDYAWEQGQNRFSVSDSLDDFQNRRYGPRVELLRQIEHFVARRATRILTPSRYLAGIVARWGITDEKITVVPNAVEMPTAAPFSSLSSRLPTVVTAGRLLPWKGMRELVAAMPGVREVVPGATLTVIGDGPLLLALEEDARWLGVFRAVNFTGRLPREEVQKTIAASRVFVLNSSYEGFSHQLLEAMALGVPVVATTAGGNAEVVKDGENALVVRPDDGAGLTAAIRRLLTDSALSERLAAAARQTAASYTVERMMAGLLSVIDNLQIPTSNLQPPTSNFQLPIFMLTRDASAFTKDSDTARRLAEYEAAGAAITVELFTPARVFTLLWQGLRAVGRGWVVTSQDPFESGLLAWIIARARGASLELQLHGDFFGPYWKREAWHRSTRLVLARWLLKRTDSVRVPSERVLSSLRGIVHERKVFRLPVAGQMLAGSDKQRERTTIFYAGRFERGKNLPLLLASFGELLLVEREAKLILAGSGGEESNLRQFADKLGISGSVEFLSEQKSLAEFFNRTAVCALPSNHESWSRFVIEAAETGCPVVMTDVGCAGEVIKNGESGWVVAVGDRLAFAAALIAAVKDPNEARRRAAAAKQAAQKLPSREEAAKMIVQNWRALAEGHRP
ncbi:glycosyltransferase [Patescibacteria group bacterium]|nr:MAG: glycosyltransferase [Patescibacteria group bacterium]